MANKLNVVIASTKVIDADLTSNLFEFIDVVKDLSGVIHRGVFGDLNGQ